MSAYVTYEIVARHGTRTWQTFVRAVAPPPRAAAVTALKMAHPFYATAIGVAATTGNFSVHRYATATGGYIQHMAPDYDLTYLKKGRKGR